MICPRCGSPRYANCNHVSHSENERHNIKGRKVRFSKEAKMLLYFMTACFIGVFWVLVSAFLNL